MNIVVVTFRDPLVLAKECATIDWLSGGRLLPAFGVGPPIAPEWAATGREQKGSGALVDEALAIMSRSVGGRPRHLRGPFLPLHRRADRAASRSAAAATLDRWSQPRGDPAHGATRDGLARRRGVARAGGCGRGGHQGRGRRRGPSHRCGPLRRGVRLPLRAPDEPLVQRTGAVLAKLAGTDDPARHVAVGGASDILARIDEFVRAGVSKFVLRPIAFGDADVMDQTERLIAEVIPAVHGRARAA